MTYDTAFYDQINAGSISSAEKIVPNLPVPPHIRKSVIDFGCGEGAWLSVFEKYGWEVRGIDGPWVDKSRLLIDENKFVPHDFEEPIYLGDNYTLSISLEVAEHLPEYRGDNLICSLTKAAPNILFSAAIPGQGGEGHVNEQWPTYWEQKFNRYGFKGTSDMRWNIWDDEDIEPWYRQNLIFYTKNMDMSMSSPVVDVVHRHNWDYHHLGIR